MVRAIITLLLFIGTLAAIGYGVLWYVDNKEVVLPEQTDASISSIQNSQSQADSEDQQVSQESNDDADASDLSQKDTASEKIPEVTLDKNKVSVLVLNGGSAKGAAGTMKTFIEKLGFTQVAADNAKAYDYTGITLYYQDKDIAKQVEDLLEPEYGDINKEEAKTSGQKIADIVIVIGQ